MKSEINKMYESFNGIVIPESVRQGSSEKRKISNVRDIPFVKAPDSTDSTENNQKQKISSARRSMTEVSYQVNRPQRPPQLESRSRSEREMVQGHECEECKRYYRIMEQQGLITTSTNHECGLNETLRRCSRHKSHWSPPSTPDGFWDLTVHTPEEWKDSKKSKKAHSKL